MTLPQGTSGTPPVGEPTQPANVSSVGAWSDASAWPSGRVPGSGDRVVIPAGTTIRLDGDVSVAGIDIEGQLYFDPSSSAQLTTTGNVVVTGELHMRPSGYDVDHVIEFAGVNEGAFVGGGMEVRDSDVGLWVVDGGQILLEGSPRRGWTNAVGSIGQGATTIEVTDATGWQVGDAIVIAPTAAPGNDGVGGDDLTSGFHETTIAGINGQSITLANGPNRAHPAVAGSYTAEVMNLTRNVEIRGTSSGNAHVFIRSGGDPVFMRWVSLDHLGVRGALGRYPLHFHHNNDQAYGSLIEGVVAQNAEHHAFVPHESNGITLRDTVAYNVSGGAAYWWDHGDQSSDLLMEHVISAATDQSGFFLGRGTNIVARDAVAVGVNNWANAGGYEWENGAVGNWGLFNLVAHNNLSSGIRVWQNSDVAQVVDGYVAYHNHEYAIDHGAYSNRYQYRNAHLIGNRQGGVWLQATSYPVPISFENVIFDDGGVAEGSPVVIGGGAVPAPIPALFHNIEFRGSSGSTPLFHFLGGNRHQAVCSECAWPAGAELFSFDGGEDGTWFELIDGSGSARYYPDGSSADVSDALPATYGSGTGLTVEYFANADLTELRYSGLLPGATDGWEVEPGQPDYGIMPYYRLGVEDGSSSRWSGQLEIPAGSAGDMTLATEYAGGVPCLDR